MEIYVNESLKVAFFVSDINIDKVAQRDVSKAVLRWTIENECKLIISVQGIKSSSSSHHSQNRNEIKVTGKEDSNYDDNNNNELLIILLLLLFLQTFMQ